MELSIPIKTGTDFPISTVSTSERNGQLLQLQQLLDSDDLSLSFQPILDLQDEELEQYEVRIAMTEAGFGLTTQQAFDLASKYGLGEKIDRWIITRTVKALEQLPTSKLCYVLNLTPCSLNSDSFLSWLEKAIQTISPSRLVFQVSENSALLAHCQLVRFQRCLRTLGIQLSISNFSGTTESFSCLRLFGPDQVKQIKIDASLFHDLSKKRESRTKLKQLIMQLRRNGVRPIASAIEDFSVLPLLWKLGVGAVQGNCVQPPGSLQNFPFPKQTELGSS